jgi:D-serine deaminase-like pyridoxal phosphate-dependent protein
MGDGSLGPNEGLIGQPGSRHRLSTPALVLDLDHLEANVASMAAHARANGYALRPVAKVHKSTAIAHLQSAAGALGTCCSTLAEAEVLVDAGIAGVLLFTSVVTSSKLERLAALNARADGLLVAVDDRGTLERMGAAARAAGRPLRVLVDVEVGGGRTGTADAVTAIELARLAAATEGLEYAGVQGYDGTHQATVDLAARRAAEAATLARLRSFVDALAAAGFPPEIVSGGGTGTHDLDHELGVLTEVQVGSYVFVDGNYADAVLRRDEAHPFTPSLTVRATVVSAAQPGFVVTDAGAKELVGLGAAIAPRVLRGAPPGSRYSVVGDDMGRIDLPAGAPRPAVGDAVEVLPPYCYQTVALHARYHCVRGDDLVDVWPIDALAAD